MKLLPPQPTEEMIEAGDNVAIISYEWGINPLIENTDEVYKAMYEAAPTIAQEPILYAVEDWKNCLYIFNGQTLCSGVKNDLHKLPLYLAPPDQSQRITELESQNKMMLEALEAISGTEYALSYTLDYKVLTMAEYAREALAKVKK